MWRELVRQRCPSATFRSPATHEELANAEAKLGLALDEQLRNCLSESNGINGEYGLGLVWPLVRIVHDNQYFGTDPDFRELYMPFDNLPFFGDAGNGDQVAFPIQDGAIRNLDVFAWDHEDDSRTWVAPSLVKYLEWWLSGKIKL